MHELVKLARAYASISPSALQYTLNHEDKIALNLGLSSF